MIHRKFITMDIYKSHVNNNIWCILQSEDLSAVLLVLCDTATSLPATVNIISKLHCPWFEGLNIII